MTQEVYVDGIGNISVQGPVVTLAFTRSPQGQKAEDSPDQEVLYLTMTGQNLLKVNNILNNTIKRLAERSRAAVSENNKGSTSINKGSNRSKKDKTVN